MTKPSHRLRELNITLPEAAAPVANYVAFTRSGNLVFISGQVSKLGEKAVTGQVGKDVSAEEGREAARISGINILSQLKAALGGDLDKARRCLRLGVFVNSADGFTGQPQVANGASDLMVEVFGEAGKHARAAVGVNTLPLGVAVEVDAVFEVE